MGIADQVDVDPAAFEYTNTVKPVVVIVMARESQRADAAELSRRFVVTVGAAGNVKPNDTDAVKLSCVVKVRFAVPRRVQFVKFVMSAAPAAISVCMSVMSDWIAAISESIPSIRADSVVSALST
jgi:hypothetical protein